MHYCGTRNLIVINACIYIWSWIVCHWTQITPFMQLSHKWWLLLLLNSIMLVNCTLCTLIYTNRCLHSLVVTIKWSEQRSSASCRYNTPCNLLILQELWFTVVKHNNITVLPYGVRIMYKLQAVASDWPSLPLRTVSVLSTGSPPENCSVWCFLTMRDKSMKLLELE